MLNKEQSVQVSDTTEVQSSNAAGHIKIYSFLIQTFFLIAVNFSFFM